MLAPVHGRPPLPGGPYVVVGLKRSGAAAVAALRARGESVIGVDAAPLNEDLRARLEATGAEVRASDDGLAALERARTLVKSPGVPQEAPVVAEARRLGHTVIGELELAWRLLPNAFVAVTGSNGKTTTVELLGEIHRAAGRPVAVAGNVGTALSSLIGVLPADATIVCEASSFQLEDVAAFAPEVAVLLNITPDHLDRHGDLAAYRAAKLRIFANQDASDVAVLPRDLGRPDPAGAARRVTFGTGAGDDLADRDGFLWWRGERLIGTGEIRLRGLHNRENAMAAAAAALSASVPADAVRGALTTFAGVAHRLEEVAHVEGVLFVNDSKATNVASAVVGITSFPGGVHAILGGRGKGEDYADLAPAVASRARAAYVIGETAGAIAAAIQPTGVPVRQCGDLEAAVALARAAAQPGEVVLLSPACASFDQYGSYEERGEHFRALARAR